MKIRDILGELNAIMDKWTKNEGDKKISHPQPMNVKIINIDLYGRGVAVLCGSMADVKQWLSNQSAEAIIKALETVDWNVADGVTIDDGKDIFIISNAPMALSVLSHELCHAALKICRIIGIDPLECEEAYAYLFEYLLDEVISSPDGVLSPLSRDAS